MRPLARVRSNLGARVSAETALCGPALEREIPSTETSFVPWCQALHSEHIQFHKSVKRSPNRRRVGGAGQLSLGKPREKELHTLYLPAPPLRSCYCYFQESQYAQQQSRVGPPTDSGSGAGQRIPALSPRKSTQNRRSRPRLPSHNPLSCCLHFLRSTLCSTWASCYQHARARTHARTHPCTVFRHK